MPIIALNCSRAADCKLDGVTITAATQSGGRGEDGGDTLILHSHLSSQEILRTKQNGPRKMIAPPLSRLPRVRAQPGGPGLWRGGGGAHGDDVAAARRQRLPRCRERPRGELGVAELGRLD